MKPPRVPDPRNIEVIDDATAAMFRAMTPAQTVWYATALHTGVCETLGRYLRRVHPEWNAEEGNLEAARMMLIAAEDEFIPPIHVPAS